MSAIQEMKETLGIKSLTMRYEDGGKTEVFSAEGIEYSFAGGTQLHTVTNVIAEARKALGSNPS